LSGNPGLDDWRGMGSRAQGGGA